MPGEVELGEVEPLVLELVAQGEELRKELITEKNERLLYTIACKSAVKANMRMSKIEMETLVRNVLRLKNINTCPHGRPIIVTMSKKELERSLRELSKIPLIVVVGPTHREKRHLRLILQIYVGR